MTVPGWRSIATPLVDVLVPEAWLEVDSHATVLAVAEPESEEVEFRANGVLVVRPTSEPIHVLGARAIAEALAYPGWSHVIADQSWRFSDDLRGRVVESLYEDLGICVNVTRYIVSTGRHTIDLTMSASLRDRFRLERLFDMIAGGMTLKEQA
ncbi:hypothetical protein [Curtobacterium sp. Leaf261]|uniref:hypothetical protein n=1 Tax=Curtobacterium sp. Leaf261 TaxID=1736311 RepID=UPI00071313A2|nr:hypothetical protein [Curtobacterium sp. Leaf261]KQO64994.1 hypothetical protein ASF23_02245 [Curtobacterium sp. Leaf261]